MTKLQALLDRLDIQQWDVLLIGDGSGTRWEFPVGWAVILVDLVKGHRKLLTGAMNTGTINAVELFPYLYALRYHYYCLYKGKLPRPYQVHIVSDSQITVYGGRGIYARKKNKDLWCMLDFWLTQGYNLTWHYVAAHVVDEPESHSYADAMANWSRKTMELAPSLDAWKGVLE